MEPAALIKRFDRLRSDSQTFRSHWQEVADLVLPSRDFTIERSPGQKRNNKIFDATAPWANEQFAGGLHGLLTSPGLKWFSLRTRRDELNQVAAVKNWLEDCERRMYAVFNAPDYNFNPSVGEVYLETGGFGNGIMFIGEKPGSLSFQARPLGENYIAENDDGKVDTNFRCFHYTARQCVQAFGAKNVHEDVIKKLETDPDYRFEVLHAVYPNGEHDSGKNETKRNMRWRSQYLLLQQKHNLQTSGFREFPFMVARWMKVAGEVWARGPGMVLLPDIRMLNEMMRTTIRSAQKRVDPPLQLPDDGFLGPIRMAPSALNYYRSGSQDRIEPIETRGSPELGLEVIESVRRSVIRGWYVDLMNMPDEKYEGSRVSATWTVQRRQEKMRVIAPMLSRLQSEFLGPIIDRVFAIMQRQNAFLPAPPELADEIIDIDYVSPIAKAQRAQEAESIINLFGLLAPLAQVDPEAMAVVNTEEVARYGQDLYGAPTRILRSREEMGQRRQQAEAMKQAAMMGQMGQVGADVVKTASEGRKVQAEAASVEQQTASGAEAAA